MSTDGNQAVDTASVTSVDIQPVGVAGDTQTDDQILDVQPETSSSAAPEVEVTETAETTAADKTTEHTDAEAEITLEPGVIPPELKHLMRDAKVAPHLQRLVDQNSAYRQFGTVGQLRTINDAITRVGGVEQLEQVAAKAISLDEADDAFNGTPEQQQTLAEEWLEDSPDAFRSMVSTGAKLLAQRDPQGYAAMTAEIFGGRVSELGWDEQIEAIDRALQAGDSKRLEGLANWLVESARKSGVQWQGGRGRVSPERQRFEAERSRFEKDRETHAVTQVRAFQSGVHDDVSKQVTSSVQSVITNALKTSVFSDEGKKAIVQQVVNDIDNAMKADRAVGRQFLNLIRSDNTLSQRTKQQAVALLVGRAKSLIAATAKKVIAQRTKEVVSRQSSVNSKKTNAATRQDVRGGAAPITRTAKLDKKTAAGMSDDEIMDA